MALIQRSTPVTLDARLQGATVYVRVGAGRTASVEVVGGTIATAVIGVGRAGEGGTYGDFASAKSLSAGSLSLAPFGVEGVHELALQVTTRDAAGDEVQLAITISEEVT